uniref:CARD domain-containing protein n=1 Tax=Periophthalmus magnuspinnatus TaxID=409849 RepID=A0A3B4BBM0_9GOBI
MIKVYLNQSFAGTRRDQARQLARDIETRGSRAFSLFVESLEETGQMQLAVDLPALKCG